MPSAKKAADSRSQTTFLGLKGSDLKKSELAVTVLILGAHEAPDSWNSPIVLDIEENHGFTAMALNKTNTRILCEKIDDDYDLWAGYEVSLAKVKVNNPQGGIADSLQVEAVRKSKRKILERKD